MALIPDNIIANADDLGYSPAINQAILYCFEQGYINSTSLMTNLGWFDEAVDLIHQSKAITQIGLHINLAEGRPLTNFSQPKYLDAEGNFDVRKINNALNILTPAARQAFSAEIYAQIDRALSNKVPIVHIDSHCHIHTLPCFYKLFSDAAKHYKLKIRLAQTYNEGSYLKFSYRKYINKVFSKNEGNYSAFFETVDHFLAAGALSYPKGKLIEVMLHPHFNELGVLEDHFEKDTIRNWLNFLHNKDQY